MAYESVKKPASTFVPVQKKASQFGPPGVTGQRVETSVPQAQEPTLSNKPATAEDWLMKSPLFTGHHLLQKLATPESESVSSDRMSDLTTGTGQAHQRQEENVQRTESATPHSLLPSPHSLPLQAKLTIGEPGDKYEQEADRVASQVVEQIHAPASAQSTQGQSVQRQEEKPEELQAKSTLKSGEEIAGGEATNDLDTAINSARGSGQPLDAGLQRSMRQAMGADFSGVKAHTDAQSDQLNQSIQAKAFTTGQDVFFRQGAYDPGSRRGQELIAHELTHVVQQKGGAVQRIRPSMPNKGDVSDLAVPQNQGYTSDMDTFMIQRVDEEGHRDTKQQWRESHADRAYLWDGIDEGMDINVAAAHLLVNFRMRTDFAYEGSGIVFSGEGDCGTLSDEFCQILIYGFGFSGITTKSESIPMLIDPGCWIIDNKKKKGNVDGGKAWIFASHTWVMVGAQPIDVLFGRYGKQPAKLGKKLGKDRYEFDDQQYVALGQVSDPTHNYKKVTGKLRNIL